MSTKINSRKLSLDELRVKCEEMGEYYASQKSENNTEISLNVIKKTVKSYYNLLIKKNSVDNEFMEFDKIFIDEYFEIQNTLIALNSVSIEYGDLPAVKHTPVIFLLMSFCAENCGGEFTPDNISTAISGFQRFYSFNISEICAIENAAKCGLLNYFCNLAQYAINLHEIVRKAKKDAIDGSFSINHISNSIYIYTLLKNADNSFSRQIMNLLSDNGLEYAALENTYYKKLSDLKVNFSSIIASLKNISEICSPDFLLQLSNTAQYLEEIADPIFSASDEKSKFYILGKINSEKKEESELVYAKKLIEQNKDFALTLKTKDNVRGDFYCVFCLIISLLITVLFVYVSKNILFCFFSILVYFIVKNILRDFFSIGKKHKKILSIPIENIERTKTLIVSVNLINNMNDAKRAVDHILTLRYANSGYDCCILCDFSPSTNNYFTMEENEISDYLCKAAEGEDFGIAIRKRFKSEKEKIYRGYEKKRGAIYALNDYILTGDKSSFKTVCNIKTGYEYAITLDEDSVIFCADELTSMVMHPANRENTIISLKSKIRAADTQKSLYTKLFYSQCAGNYDTDVLDFEQDVLGCSNFTGKGIYRVKDFNDKLKNAFPDESILSHDFLEGAFANVVVSDEVAFESVPDSFSKELARNLRWLRGDVQLIPFLKSKIKDKNGNKVLNPLNFASQTHIFDNIIHGFVSVLMLVTLTCFVFTAKFIYLVLPLIILFYPIFINFLISPCDLIQLFKSVFVSLIRLLTLPATAIMEFCAVIITLKRLVTKTKLLEWKTFAHTKSNNGYIKVNLFVAAVYILAGIAFNSTLSLFAGLFFSFIWIVPLLSKHKIDKSEILEPEFLQSVAFDTWKYYKEHFKNKRFLISDNCCFRKEIKFANRTSPTNIGFSIIATLCAYLNSFIDYATFESIIENVLNELEILDKWHGHFYNWYDTESKAVLYPSYVSTVDSGNLFVCLSFILRYVNTDLREKINNLIENVDFNVLLDSEKGLLYIGYNGNERRYDTNHYDLFASEALLTYIFCVAYEKLPIKTLEKLSRKSYKGCLLSWTGGAFEYLMPWLFLRLPNGTAIEKELSNFVKLQFKNQKNGLWGISECQYDSFDDSGNYRYKAFGIKNVAISNDTDDSVFAPYASIMTLFLSDKNAVINMKQLMSMGMYGQYGFYESYDMKPIKTYMAHHQGMILLAITGYLKPSVVYEYMTNPRISAVIQKISELHPIKICSNKKQVYLRKSKTVKIRQATMFETVPELNFCSNGQYYANHNSDMSGYSLYDGKTIYNNGIRIKISSQNKEISFNHVEFFIDKTIYSANSNNIKVKAICSVFSGYNGEYRQIEFENVGYAAVNIDLSLSIAAILKEFDAYIAHAEYNKLFIDSYIINGIRVIQNRKNGLYVCAAMTDANSFFLDGIAVFESKITLEPLSKKQIYFNLLVGYNIDEIIGKMLILSDIGILKRTLLCSEEVVKQYSLEEDDCCLAKRLIYESFGSNSNLIKFGYYYNYPVECLEIESGSDIAGVLIKLKKFAGMYKYGIKFDIVVCIDEFGGYYDSLKKLAEEIIIISGILKAKPADCYCKIVRKYEAKQLKKLNIEYYVTHNIPCDSQVGLVKIQSPYTDAEIKDLPVKALNLACGYFTAESSFVCQQTSRPFSNIISNEQGGTIITNNGGGFTFGMNSREFKFTNFDGISESDFPSETIVAEENGNTWSLLCDNINGKGKHYVEHGLGYTKFYVCFNGIFSTVSVTIDTDGTKIYYVDLVNQTEYNRRIKLYFAFIPVIGDFAYRTENVLTVADSVEGCVEITNAISGKKVFFYTDSKESFVIYSAQKAKKFLKTPKKYPILSTVSDIQAYGKGSVNFYIGLSHEIKNKSVLESQKKFYSNLSLLSVNFSDNISYLIQWLPYQVFCSRFHARAGYYQISGAYGFRDQLQDCLTMLYISPKAVRSHLLFCAGRQFVSGDVMHWWHEPFFGVRTKIVDDRLFLPYVVAEYIEFTGECEILAERIPFLKDVLIPMGQESVCENMSISDEEGSLLEHCKRAIFSVCDLIAPDGLVFMHGGDWNDAMNLVGAKGRGKSVWLSMFLFEVINKFIKYVTVSDEKRILYAYAEKLRNGVDKQFNGEYYNRAITDDGVILGNPSSPECKIDLLTQAYSVISGIADRDKSLSAISAAEKLLIDHENKIIKLLDPPFKNMDDIGYIRDYPAGVRENGGQYTHASVWFVIALYKLGLKQKAYKYLTYLNPIVHCLDKADSDKYGAEPYVVSADVYSGSQAGKAGWSWYTGSASWMYIAIVRYLFGIEIKNSKIKISPELPDTIENATVKVCYRECVLTVLIDNTEKCGEWSLVYNNVTYNSNVIDVKELKGSKTINLKRNNNA